MLKTSNVLFKSITFKLFSIIQIGLLKCAKMQIAIWVRQNNVLLMSDQLNHFYLNAWNTYSKFYNIFIYIIRIFYVPFFRKFSIYFRKRFYFKLRVRVRLKIFQSPFFIRQVRSAIMFVSVVQNARHKKNATSNLSNDTLVYWLGHWNLSSSITFGAFFD